MKRTAFAALAAIVLATGAAPAAIAGDISNDIRDIQRDKARLSSDYRHLQEERRELRQAERREHWAWRHHNWWQSRRAERQERHERRDIQNIEQQITRDRARLARDRSRGSAPGHQPLLGAWAHVFLLSPAAPSWRGSVHGTRSRVAASPPIGMNHAIL